MIDGHASYVCKKRHRDPLVSIPARAYQKRPERSNTRHPQLEIRWAHLDANHEMGRHVAKEEGQTSRIAMVWYRDASSLSQGITMRPTSFSPRDAPW